MRSRTGGFTARTDAHATEAEGVVATGWLTPWGTDFRYDDEPLHSLNEDLALKVAAEAVAWSEGLLTRMQADDDGESEVGRGSSR